MEWERSKWSMAIDEPELFVATTSPQRRHVDLSFCDVADEENLLDGHVCKPL